MTQEEMVQLSGKTNDSEELSRLAKSPYMLVRRSVARNKHTNAETINKLSQDKVKNVVYFAFRHPNCSNHRNSMADTSHPCVICEKEESLMIRECINCETLNNYIEQSA